MGFKLTPAEARAKWVEALRSGEFRQGRTCLRSPSDGFCCLGVACEVYRREESVGRWHGGAFEASDSFRDRDTGFLPPPVQEWLGLGNHAGDLDTEVAGGWSSLLSLNDGAGYTFDEIARVIEAGRLTLMTKEF